MQQQSCIGIAVTDATMQREWNWAVERLACIPITVEVLAELPATQIRVYLVALDSRRTPVQLGFWLATLTAPIVLVTPHIIPAQTLCRWVPRLAVICPPTLAAANLADYLSMAQSVTHGTLVLQDEPSRTPRSYVRGVA